MEDPDEGKNGEITMALQVGMPRLDFFLNTSSGVLTSMAVLDREQIQQYYLRIIAYDAGKFPRTSTSTLTVLGESLIPDWFLCVTCVFGLFCYTVKKSKVHQRSSI